MMGVASIRKFTPLVKAGYGVQPAVLFLTKRARESAASCAGRLVAETAGVCGKCDRYSVLLDGDGNVPIRNFHSWRVHDDLGLDARVYPY
jgi:hypothetical protein